MSHCYFNFEQKLVMQKITVPRVPSHNASERTVRSRSYQLKQMVTKLSSPDDTDDDAAEMAQLAALLKGKSRKELKMLLEKYGLTEVYIPGGTELTMKAQMGWTWNEMRKLKRLVHRSRSTTGVVVNDDDKSGLALHWLADNIQH